MTTKPTGDIAAHRLSSTQLSCEFADIAPLLDPTAAAAAASTVACTAPASRATVPAACAAAPPAMCATAADCHSTASLTPVLVLSSTSVACALGS